VGLAPSWMDVPNCFASERHRANSGRFHLQSEKFSSLGPASDRLQRSLLPDNRSRRPWAVHEDGSRALQVLLILTYLWVVV